MKLSVDTKEIKKFTEDMKRFPMAIRPAISNTLNKQAMDMKFDHIPAALDQDMVIRDKRFMSRQLRFTKARANQNPRMMFSEAGSVDIEKGGSKGAFTGWEEQQTGQASEKDRVASQASRVGNSFKGRMRPKDRMKKQNMSRFVTPKDFMNTGRIRSKNKAMFLMLREAKHSRRTFIIPKGFRRTGATRKMKAGLYGWIGKRLMRLQRFDKKYKPERTDWMGDSLKILVKKSGGFEKVFSWQLQKVIKQFDAGKV
jgi:hypothetical protein